MDEESWWWERDVLGEVLDVVLELRRDMVLAVHLVDDSHHHLAHMLCKTLARFAIRDDKLWTTIRQNPSNPLVDQLTCTLSVINTARPAIPFAYGISSPSAISRNARNVRLATANPVSFAPEYLDGRGNIIGLPAVEPWAVEPPAVAVPLLSSNVTWLPAELFLRSFVSGTDSLSELVSGVRLSARSLPLPLPLRRRSTLPDEGGGGYECAEGETSTESLRGMLKLYLSSGHTDPATVEVTLGAIESSRALPLPLRSHNLRLPVLVFPTSVAVGEANNVDCAEGLSTIPNSSIAVLEVEAAADGGPYCCLEKRPRRRRTESSLFFPRDEADEAGDGGAAAPRSNVETGERVGGLSVKSIRLGPFLFFP